MPSRIAGNGAKATLQPHRKAKATTPAADSTQTVAAAAHRLRDAMSLQDGAIGTAGVLHATVAVVDQSR